ncbi:methionine-R-sulfoxide reductase B1 isoform X1 [Glossina fuscipes]|uniref:Peptide-methionine (R)-S-oxide reductase n=2 Tax=Glossina fuscipes TaxID=7396 RepID=A0A9C6DLK4_9MUSC|nr:methionine-R-sulfoxide reductase B1 isoform X1 [Glossina fuscipes]XP_037892067.1 methionine-R-sulfoxide reductase B1 isoform X1 [Glossina fuscipes]
MFSLFRHALRSSINKNKIVCLKNCKIYQIVEAAASITPVIFAHSKSFASDTSKNNINSNNNMENRNDKISVDKAELRKRLTPLQYQVTQEAATERPFTGCYNKHYEKGVYQCIVCHQDLFSSDTKYDSGCGWPAFNDVLDKGKVTLHRDASIPVVISKMLGMIRTEVRCSKCGAHMGHVFDDGPPPKYLRYCINSASINFVAQPAKPSSSNQASGSASTNRRNSQQSGQPAKK